MLGGPMVPGEENDGSMADGRRRYPSSAGMQDHGPFPSEQALPSGQFQDEVFGARGRRAFPQEDHVKSNIFQPAEATSGRAVSPDEIKAQVLETLAKVHGVAVVDERRWADVAVERNGWNWKIQAYNEQRRLLCRDGPTAHALAEKLAMTSTGELRFFGVRMAGGGVPTESSPGQRVKGSPHEDNPTLVSPGIFGALEADEAANNRPRLRNCQELSSTRKDPTQMSRRYIASGKDHWQSAQVASHSERGDAGDMAFCDGLERGIGHGRRHFDRRDHFVGAAVAAASQ